MTYDEAVCLRAKHLQGNEVLAANLERALEVIRTTPAPTPTPKSLPKQLLRALADGPMEREEFYTLAKALYRQAGRKSGPIQRINQMMDEEFICCEIRLGPKGLDAIRAMEAA